MLHICPYTPDWRSDPVLTAMFTARKQVFVDLLKWQIPVLADRYEIDAFDAPGAVYLVLTTPDGRHLASTRLLLTDRPHLLDSLFADLCASPPPTGQNIREITRFCLDRSLRAADRLQIRNALVLALVDYALDTGITTYTGVAEMAWFQQILAFGWQCRALGIPVSTRSGQLVALRIDIAPETPALLAEAGFTARHKEVRHAA